LLTAHSPIEAGESLYGDKVGVFREKVHEVGQKGSFVGQRVANFFIEFLKLSRNEQFLLY